MGSMRFSMKLKGAVSAFALAGVSILSPAAADYDDALRAYGTHPAGELNRAQIDAALDQWLKDAKSGDILSRSVLGDLFSNQPIYDDTGSVQPLQLPLPEDAGVEENRVEALAWYIIAAAHDFEDHNQTPSFRELNARIHAAERVPSLKMSMTTNQVVEAEDRVIQIMSSSDSAYDLYRLGVMLQAGNGLPKDNVLALTYYRLAVERARTANPTAASAASYLRSLMTAEEHEETDLIVASWEPPLPDIYRRQSPLVTELRNQNQVLREQQNALALDRIEAEFNDRNEHIFQNALAALGLYRGEIDGQVGPETREAVRRFQFLLVEDDDNLSLDAKMDMRTGSLTVIQKVELVRWAAEVNHPQSQYIYGIMNARGIGVPIDGEAAINWMQRSASFGYPLAHYALGTFYRDGIYGEYPVEPSLAEASRHFGQAAALGYDPAQRALVELNYEFNYTHD